MNEHSGPVIEFADVSLSFGGTPALRGVRFEVRAGETLVLLGRSGSGKSTALRLVNALLMPDAGRVRVRGTATTEWEPIRLRRAIGYVIQEGGLFPHLTVAGNVAVVPRLLEWERSRIESRVDELLALVGLPPDEHRDRYPRELSGGQRQRVGVARALAADPDILLCDEPFGALDPITRFQLQREFGALGRRLGKSLLFVTHDVREAELLADRIAFLEAGELRFLGSASEFKASEEPGVRAFLEAAGLSGSGRESA